MIVLHPINTGLYESKICPFGKNVIWLLIIFLLYRSFNNVSKRYTIITTLITLVLSTMNMNAFVYLLPYFFIEIYKIYL